MSCVGALPPFFCFVRFSFAGRSGLAANLPRPIRGNSLPLPCLIRMHSDSQLTVISTVKYNGSMRLQQVLRRLICMHTYNTCTQTHTLTLPHTHSESLSGSLTRSLAHSLSLSRALCLCLSACFTHTHTHTHTFGMTKLCLCLQPAASTRSPRTRTTKSRWTQNSTSKRLGVDKSRQTIT